MRNRYRLGVAVAVLAAVVVTGAVEVRAASTAGSSNMLFLKVYRVFGDEEPDGDGARAPRKSTRKKSRRSAKGQRVERPKDAVDGCPTDSHTGILDLLQPIAGVKALGQNS